MTYKIAGITVNIFGDCRMQPQTVEYYANKSALCYQRQGCTLQPEKKYILTNGITEQDVLQNIEQKPVLCNTAQGVTETDQNGNSLYILKRLSDYKIHENSNPDITITYGVVPRIELPQGDTIGAVRGFLCVQTPQGISILNEIPLLADYGMRIDFNKDFSKAHVMIYDVSSLGGLDLDARLHSYIGEAFAYMVLKYSRLVFHSAAILYNGQGVCFSAPSGTGKSTHADLWKEFYNAERLNDDTPVLYLKENTPVVCGSPWSGKSELNINAEVPLKAIVCLRQSPENKIEQIKGIEALRHITAEAKIPEIPELFQSGINQISNLLSVLPIHRLYCNISKDAVDLVKGTLNI